MALNNGTVKDSEIIKAFLGQKVTVEVAGYKVKGVLKAVENSAHNGFGNLFLAENGADRLTIVRGSVVVAIKRAKF